MAWRLDRCLIKGELDNTTPNRVSGWMRFAGLKKRVTFNLVGDFHRDIRGTKIRFVGKGELDGGDMEGFCLRQKGDVGDITAGHKPADYVDYPYIEWYADNGRVVLELNEDQIEVLGRPIPALESFPGERKE